MVIFIEFLFYFCFYSNSSPESTTTAAADNRKERIQIPDTKLQLQPATRTTTVCDWFPTEYDNEKSNYNAPPLL
jgi:hypothetical protein